MGRSKQHRLLLLLDEFPALGRLAGFEKMLGLMAGYGMQAMLVCQSLNSIRGIYGRDNVILENCEVVTTFTINDPGTAETLSRMAGDIWEMVPQETRHQAGLFESDRRSVTMKEERRPLLLPADFLRLSNRDMVIFAGDRPPIRARKLRYDEEPRLRDLLVPGSCASRFLTLDHDWVGVRPSSAEDNAAKNPKALPPPPRRDRRSKGI